MTDLETTGGLEAPEPAASAVDSGASSEANGSTDHSAAEAKGDSGVVPRHVLDREKGKRRDMEDKIKELERREREWQQRYVQQAESVQTRHEPQYDPYEDMDEDEVRMAKLEQRAASAEKAAQEAKAAADRVDLERQVKDAVFNANRKAQDAGIPIEIEDQEIYARVAANYDGRYGQTVEEVVRGYYNREFDRFEKIQQATESKLKQSFEAARNAGETNGKLDTPTPPKPVEWTDVETKDLWATAEKSMLEALSRGRK